MSAKISKRERLMNLLSALLAAREPLAFREIIGRVIGYDDPGAEEALEKRFDRDKTDLRRLGIPIDYIASDDPEMKSGYVIRPEKVFQQKLTFTPQETVLLAIAGRVGAAATGGGALEDALKSALRKIAVDLPGPDPLEESAEVSVLRSRCGDPRTLANVSVLAHAVSAGRGVRFDYAGLDPDPSEGAGPATRMVDPWGLGLVRGEWFVVGHCHLRGAIRVFKASRIAGTVALTSGPREAPPPDFRIEDHLGREVWNFGDGPPAPVRLRVAHSAGGAGADDFAGTAGLPGARVLMSGAGFSVIEADVRSPKSLVPWILSHAGRVTVLDPPSLRQEVAAAARRMLQGGARTVPAAPARTVPAPPRSRFDPLPAPDPAPGPGPESNLEPQLLDVEGEAS